MISARGDAQIFDRKYFCQLVDDDPERKLQEVVGPGSTLRVAGAINASDIVVAIGRPQQAANVLLILGCAKTSCSESDIIHARWGFNVLLHIEEGWEMQFNISPSDAYYYLPFAWEALAQAIKYSVREQFRI